MISSFEEGLITDVWTQYITSLSTWNDFVLCELMLKILLI